MEVRKRRRRRRERSKRGKVLKEEKWEVEAEESRKSSGGETRGASL